MQVTVKAARVMAGLTQRQAAEGLGVSRNTYMWLEKHPERASMETANKLCSLFGVSMDDVNFLPETTHEV